MEGLADITTALQKSFKQQKRKLQNEFSFQYEETNQEDDASDTWAQNLLSDVVSFFLMFMLSFCFVFP